MPQTRKYFSLTDFSRTTPIRSIRIVVIPKIWHNRIPLLGLFYQSILYYASLTQLVKDKLAVKIKHYCFGTGLQGATCLNLYITLRMFRPL
jgi:hypothetical protein